MGQIIEGAEALDFNPDFVNDNVSVDSSRAVKVSTLFVDKITSLYSKKMGEGKTSKPIEEEVAPVVETQSEEPEYEEPVYNADVQYNNEEETPEVEVSNEEPEVEETPEVEVPNVEPTPEVTPIADPNGMLSDIASSFEVAVSQIHAKQAEVEARELEIEKIKASLIIKEEKTDKLLDELEKMKKDVETSKKDADKIIREAEVQERALEKRIAAFEAEREKFLNNLKVTTGSIMNMFDKKN